jgi:hypothetical protein
LSGRCKANAETKALGHPPAMITSGKGGRMVPTIPEILREDPSPL